VIRGVREYGTFSGQAACIPDLGFRARCRGPCRARRRPATRGCSASHIRTFGEFQAGRGRGGSRRRQAQSDRRGSQTPSAGSLAAKSRSWVTMGAATLGCRSRPHCGSARRTTRCFQPPHGSEPSRDSGPPQKRCNCRSFWTRSSFSARFLSARTTGAVEHAMEPGNSSPHVTTTLGSG